MTRLPFFSFVAAISLRQVGDGFGLVYPVRASFVRPETAVGLKSRGFASRNSAGMRMCSSCYGPMARTEHSEHVEHVDLGQRKFMGGPANARIAVPQTATGTTPLKKTPVPGSRDGSRLQA